MTFLPRVSPRPTVLSSTLAVAITLAAGVAVQPAVSQTLVALTPAAPRPGAINAPAIVLVNNQQLLTAPTFLTGAEDLFGLARNPITGEVFSTDSGTNLVRVDLVNSSVSVVGALPATIGSLAFDSHGNLYGFAYCDTSFPNQLFQLDPATGMSIAALGSLDPANLAPCDGTSIELAVIAIDPADNTLFLTGVEAGGNLFIDRFGPGFVPTKVYTSIFVAGFPVIYPIAATFAGGKMWLSVSLVDIFLGANNGGLGAFDPVTNTLGNGSASITAVGLTNSVAARGLVESEAACAPSATATCLNNRFRVQASYDATPANGKGPATVLLESAQSVKFSFFDPNNVEVIVKVLNACGAPFNRWWVAAGGLTNVGVTIKVTDTKTGKVKTYSNPKNRLFQPFFDTDAFPCP